MSIDEQDRPETVCDFSGLYFFLDCQTLLVEIDDPQMSKMMEIVELKQLPESFNELIELSEKEGETFLTRMKSEWLEEKNCFDKKGEAVYGIFQDSKMIAVCGRNIDPYAGDESIGRIRHLYVRPDYRKTGLGRLLVTKALNEGESFFSSIRLRTFNDNASAFYCSLGFKKVEKDEYVTHIWNYR